MSEPRKNLTWERRPDEEARNLNPAFCGELISRAVVEYHKVRQEPFNLAVAYLVLPLSLHEPTREVLPIRANVAFVTWVIQHSPLLVDFPERLIKLQPITREALLFSIRYKISALNEGGLVPGSNPIKVTVNQKPTTEEVSDVRNCACMLGRWFARQASNATILRGFGVEP